MYSNQLGRRACARVPKRKSSWFPVGLEVGIALLPLQVSSQCCGYDLIILAGGDLGRDQILPSRSASLAYNNRASGPKCDRSLCRAVAHSGPDPSRNSCSLLSRGKNPRKKQGGGEFETLYIAALCGSNQPLTFRPVF